MDRKLTKHPEKPVISPEEAPRSATAGRPGAGSEVGSGAVDIDVEVDEGRAHKKIDGAGIDDPDRLPKG